MRIPARGAVALVLLLTAATACSQSDAQPSPAPKAAPGAIKPLPITVAKAEVREVQRSVETVGSLLAWDDAQVRTEQPGTIARLLVDLGDAVARGQVLAEYDAREFELAVKQAEADLLSSRESLARGRATGLRDTGVGAGATGNVVQGNRIGLPSGPARPRFAAPRTPWFPSRPK